MKLLAGSATNYTKVFSYQTKNAAEQSKTNSRNSAYNSYRGSSDLIPECSLDSGDFMALLELTPQFMNIPHSSVTVAMNESLKKIVKPTERKYPTMSYFCCAGIAGHIFIAKSYLHWPFRFRSCSHYHTFRCDQNSLANYFSLVW